MSDFSCERVLSGRVAVDVVYEDDAVLAFHHTLPFFTDAHVVVVPKQHVASLLDPAAEPLIAPLLSVVKRIASLVLAEHGAARVLTNLGDYQDSKHLHWHVYAGEAIAQPTRDRPRPTAARSASDSTQSRNRQNG